MKQHNCVGGLYLYGATPGVDKVPPDSGSEIIPGSFGDHMECQGLKSGQRLTKQTTVVPAVVPAIIF